MQPSAKKHTKNMKVGSLYRIKDKKVPKNTSYFASRRSTGVGRFVQTLEDTHVFSKRVWPEVVFSPCASDHVDPSSSTTASWNDLFVVAEKDYNVTLIPHTYSSRRVYDKGEKVMVTCRCTFVCCMTATFVCAIDDKMCQVRASPIATFDVPWEAIRPKRYVEMHNQCQTAVVCWMWIAKQLVFGRQRVPKDLHRLIGKLVWETRDENDWIKHRHSKPKRTAHKKVKTYAE